MYTSKKELLASIKDTRHKKLALSILNNEPIDPEEYSQIQIEGMAEYIDDNYKERHLSEGCNC